MDLPSLLYCRRFVKGNGWKEFVRIITVIHFAAVMVAPVGDNKIAYTKDKVITCSLVEGVLRDLYRRSFALHDDLGRGIFIEEHDIAPLGKFIVPKGVFERHA